MALFIFLAVVPILEIALFIEVGGWIGLWPTLAIIIATAALGAAMLRSQGSTAVRKIRVAVQNAQDPSEQLFHGLLILVSGLLLLTPGFFTDAVGFALLYPPIRAEIIKRGGRGIAEKTVVYNFRHGRSPEGRAETIDGTYSIVDEEKSERNN
ncbi:MAG: FxsA family protein [Albidovulum sp.]|nr:FxsA family protein [Albidovulum sp.]MDE0307735.1 FxsA family protein [Albidovulum sp.]MDE0532091.1 FxsA family protein [Albidovulum sp.]